MMINMKLIYFTGQNHFINIKKTEIFKSMSQFIVKRYSM